MSEPQQVFQHKEPTQAQSCVSPEGLCVAISALKGNSERAPEAFPAQGTHAGAVLREPQRISRYLERGWG